MGFELGSGLGSRVGVRIKVRVRIRVGVRVRIRVGSSRTLIIMVEPAVTRQVTDNEVRAWGSGSGSG